MSIHNVEALHRFAMRRSVTSRIKVFSLDELGYFVPESYNLIKGSFDQLPLDPYDPSLEAESLVHEMDPDKYLKSRTDWVRYWGSSIGFCESGMAGPEFWLKRTNKVKLRELLLQCKPHRRRAAYQFLVTPVSKFQVRISDIGCPAFSQEVEDIRSRPRRFFPIVPEVRENDYFRWLIAAVAQIVRQTSGLISDQFRITAHQMKTYASIDGGEPAPEGVHQDGSPFIVSGLVVERVNVVGGISRVYYKKDENIAIEVQLKEREGLFQSDMDNGYWHSISRIYRDNPNEIGYRSIIGFDIDFI